jgi:hypothetical protein
MLKIPIIDPERPAISNILFKCALVLFLLLFISIFVIDNNTVHAVLAIAGSVVGISRLFFGTFRVKGTLVLTENAFITVIKE